MKHGGVLEAAVAAIAFLGSALAIAGWAETATGWSLEQAETEQATTASSECAPCVRKDLEYLAGPSLRGRGSGTEDEHRAAQFIAARLRSHGLAPAAEDGRYIQVATIRSRRVTAPPTLSFEEPGTGPSHPITWTHNKEIVVQSLGQPEIVGPLQKLDLSDPTETPALVKDSAVVLLKLKEGGLWSDAQSAISRFQQSKAAMLVLPLPPDFASSVGQLSKLPRLPKQFGGEAPQQAATVVLAKADDFNRLWKLPDGTSIKLHADVSAWRTAHAWNVLARSEGGRERDQIVMLSAHLDHLGVRHKRTYFGADDDASGTAAVMELARVLAQQPKPARTVVFALWGSEEAGMLGARYFLAHPTFELQKVVVNLEFEMIARPDPMLAPDLLWLTGWDRSDLGEELAAHGAKVIADPHPEQNFFQRSDNYPLAKRGIIAQTISSYGLHRDYHKPTDTLAKVDWYHLDNAIGSMIAPVLWLANGDFTPTWKRGQRP
jgi:hypothetical protein